MRVEAIEEIHKAGILPDENTILILLDTIQDDFGGFGGSQHLEGAFAFALVYLQSAHCAGVGRDVGADGTGENNGDLDVGVQQFRAQAFGEEFDGGLGRAVNGLAGHGQEAAHAGDVGDMGFGPGEEMGEERFGHIQRAIEIHVHYPFNCIVAKLLELDERLNDTGVVDQAIHRAMPGDDLSGEGFDRFFIGDVDDVGGEFIFVIASQVNGFFEGGFVDVDGGHACAAGEEQQDQFAPHAIAAASDHDRFVLDFHFLLRGLWNFLE